MAFNERLAERIRSLFGERRDVAERQMFGGLTFLCRGRMCCGIVGNDSAVTRLAVELRGVGRRSLRLELRRRLRGRIRDRTRRVHRAARRAAICDAARRHAISRLIIANRHDASTTFAYPSIEDLMAFIDRRFASGPI